MRRFPALLSLSAVSIVLALALVEYGFGFYFAERNPITKEFDPLLGWRLTPGEYRVKPMYQVQPFLLRHNSLGLRGREFPPVPQDGTLRILVLGDSFTYARQWPEEVIFTTLLEKELNHRSPNSFEVVNAGVQGYGTAQQLLFARRLAEQHGLRAQTWLLAVYTNDILDNLRLSYGKRMEEQVRPRFLLNGEGKPELVDLPSKDFSGSDTLITGGQFWGQFWVLMQIKAVLGSWLQRHPEWMERFYRMGFQATSRAPGLLNGWYEQDVLERGVPLMRELIRELRDEAVANGAVLRVALIPSPLQVYPRMYETLLRKSPLDRAMVEEWLSDPMRPQRVMGEICEGLEVDYLDLHPALAEHKRGSVYMASDGHFSPEGHRVAAKRLAEFILESEVLKPEEGK